MKTYTTFDAWAYEVGQKRLKEMGVESSAFTSSDILYIGRCSLSGKKLIIGIIGKIGNNWTIKNSREQMSNRRPFVAKWIMEGEHVSKAQQHRKTSGLCRTVGVGASFAQMKSKDMFRSAQTPRPRRKAPKCSLNTRLAYAARMEKF